MTTDGDLSRLSNRALEKVVRSEDKKLRDLEKLGYEEAVRRDGGVEGVMAEMDEKLAVIREAESKLALRRDPQHRYVDMQLARARREGSGWATLHPANGAPQAWLMSHPPAELEGVDLDVARITARAG